jgi:hypothetical protein
LTYVAEQLGGETDPNAIIEVMVAIAQENGLEVT